MVDRILVLDVGSSALKAALFDAGGAILASSEAAYGLSPAPHRQTVESWWTAARAAIAALKATRIDAVALAGTMENLIPVNREGRALCDALLYSDPCGGAALDEARAGLDALHAAAILGNAPEPLMTAFKIGWLRQTRPDIFEAAAFLLPGAKDALALRLTGRAATDPVTAATTGLMDLAARDWSAPLAAALDVPREKLPAILPASAILGPLLKQAAADLGLASGIPVVNGCGDAGAATLGSFCRASGDVSLHLGTTGWLARVVEQALPFERRPVYRLAHPSPGLVIEIAPILSAGAAAAWARTVLGLSETAAEAALARADAAPPDLLFLPYLSGERSPFVDTEVRGAFLGLDAGHGAASLYYAVLEGVGFAIHTNLDALDPDGAGRIRCMGGGARSAVWPQMLADILARPLHVTASAAVATAVGGFLIAAEAFGLPGAGADASGRIEPRRDRRARADRLAAAFSEATRFARGLALREGGAGTAATLDTTSG